MNLSLRQKPYNPDDHAVIADIKRFAVHDGDGIRTTVFLKGCYLRCQWCHNPEGLIQEPQLAYYAHKCLHCGACATVCPTGAQAIKDGRHLYDRTKCVACGLCEGECPSDALKLYGRVMCVEQLLPLLLEDRPFYENTGGGVTLSGGEPLCQPEFCTELFHRLREENIHTALDTSGFAPREVFDRIFPYTNVFLYDIKAYDEDIHLKRTGVGNSIILDNLRYLDQKGAAIQIRIPYVPTMNDDQIKKIGRFLSTLQNIREIKILPYHALSRSKYDALGMTYAMPDVPKPDLPMIENAKEIMRSVLGNKGPAIR